MLLLEDVALIKAKEDTKPLIETSVVLMLNWFRFHSFNRNDRLDKITIGSELNYGNNNVDNQRKKLLGRWKKITEAKCSEIYLDDLEFKDKGIYVGKKGQKATKHPYWDVGTYQI